MGCRRAEPSRALYETVRRFPPEIQVDLFMADVAPADRFADLAAGTYRLDLPGSVASTRIYQLPAVVRALAPRLGRIGAFVVAGEGDASRPKTDGIRDQPRWLRRRIRARVPLQPFGSHC